MSIRNLLLVLLFGGTLGFLLLREQERGTLEPFDRAHREFLKANPASDTRAPVAEPSVVLVRLDDVDQTNRIFGAWPLMADDWGIILQNLAAYTPRAVAVAAPLPFDAGTGGLDSLAKQLPGLCVGVPASALEGDGEAAVPAGLPVLKVRGSVRAIPEFQSARLPPLPGLPGTGDIDLLKRDKKLTVDGDWCRVPMLARMGDKVVPSLALRALLAWTGVSPEEVVVQPGVAITGGNSLRIEIDEAGFFRYFLSLAPQVPAVNGDNFVLTREQAVQKLPADDPQRKALAGLQKSLLWIGHDDSAARLLKLPNGSPVSPAELTARAIAAIQTSSYMRPLPPHRQWIAPAATLLFCLWLTHWRKSWLLTGTIAAAIVLGGVSLYLYHSGYWWMPLLPSLALLAGCFLLSLLLPVPARRRAATEAPSPRLAAAGGAAAVTVPLREGEAGPSHGGPGATDGTDAARDELPETVPTLEELAREYPEFDFQRIFFDVEPENPAEPAATETDATTPAGPDTGGSMDEPGEPDPAALPADAAPTVADPNADWHSAAVTEHAEDTPPAAATPDDPGDAAHSKKGKRKRR